MSKCAPTFMISCNPPHPTMRLPFVIPVLWIWWILLLSSNYVLCVTQLPLRKRLALAQLVGASSHMPKGCGFDPLLGCLWEATNWSFSLCLSLSPSISLSPRLYKFLKLIHISLGEDLWEKSVSVFIKVVTNDRIFFPFQDSNMYLTFEIFRV